MQIGSSVFMILALLWLTVSTPFVYSADRLAKQEVEKKSGDGSGGNPFSNTTEERSENGTNTLSEYLHEPHIIERDVTLVVNFYKCHPSDLYFAFHPEL